MNDCDTATNVLNDLQKLHEAGRNRILNLLPPENVKNILKASLRERERVARDNTTSQDQPHGDAHRETTCATGENHGSDAAHEHNSSSKKRDRATTIFQYRKRPRVEEKYRPNQSANGSEIVEIERDEENEITENPDGDDQMSVLPNERIQQRSPIHTRSATRLTEPRHLRSRTLPIFVYDGMESERETVVSINELPAHVQNELKRRFDNIWSVNQCTVAQYAACTRNPEKYGHEFRCIHNMLGKDGCAAGKAFKQNKGPHKSMDRKCIAAGYLCARFSWNEEEGPPLFICIVPLPSGRRKGKSWDELGYWVLTEADTGMTTAR